MRKRIWIFGGTGFIGREVIQQLAELSEQYEVGMLAHRHIPFRELEHINLYTGNLETFDLSILDQFQPDYIIHMARIAGKRKWGRKRAANKGKKANERILSHLKKNHPKTYVIYVSGTLVYGDHGDQMIDERTPHTPTAFAREYMIAEKPWREAQEKGELSVSFILPPWIIGSTSWFKVFFIDPMKNRREVPLYGEGNNWMSIIDLEDCAGLIIHALRQGQPGKNYNIQLPSGYIQLKSFSELISKVSGMPVARFARKEIVHQFGKAVFEAFSFSLKSGTVNPEMQADYSYKVNSIVDSVKNNLTKTGVI